MPVMCWELQGTHPWLKEAHSLVGHRVSKQIWSNVRVWHKPNRVQALEASHTVPRLWNSTLATPLSWKPAPTSNRLIRRPVSFSRYHTVPATHSIVADSKHKRQDKERFSSWPPGIYSLEGATGRRGGGSSHSNQRRLLQEGEVPAATLTMRELSMKALKKEHSLLDSKSWERKEVSVTRTQWAGGNAP